MWRYLSAPRSASSEIAFQFALWDNSVGPLLAPPRAGRSGWLQCVQGGLVASGRKGLAPRPLDRRSGLNDA